MPDKRANVARWMEGLRRLKLSAVAQVPGIHMARPEKNLSMLTIVDVAPVIIADRNVDSRSRPADHADGILTAFGIAIDLRDQFAKP